MRYGFCSACCRLRFVVAKKSSDGPVFILRLHRSAPVSVPIHERKETPLCPGSRAIVVREKLRSL